MTECYAGEEPTELEPDATARRLVKQLLSDLPKKRRDAVAAAIVSAMVEYASEQSSEAASDAIRDHEERNY
jgi:hypothetical protein